MKKMLVLLPLLLLIWMLPALADVEPAWEGSFEAEAAIGIDDGGAWEQPGAAAVEVRLGVGNIGEFRQAYDEVRFGFDVSGVASGQLAECYGDPATGRVDIRLMDAEDGARLRMAEAVDTIAVQLIGVRDGVEHVFSRDVTVRWVNKGEPVDLDFGPILTGTAGQPILLQSAAFLPEGWGSGAMAVNHVEFFYDSALEQTAEVASDDAGRPTAVTFDRSGYAPAAVTVSQDGVAWTRRVLFEVCSPDGSAPAPAVEMWEDRDRADFDYGEVSLFIPDDGAAVELDEDASWSFFIGRFAVLEMLHPDDVPLWSVSCDRSEAEFSGEWYSDYGDQVVTLTRWPDRPMDVRLTVAAAYLDTTVSRTVTIHFLDGAIAGVAGLPDGPVDVNVGETVAVAPKFRMADGSERAADALEMCFFEGGSGALEPLGEEDGSSPAEFTATAPGWLVAEASFGLHNARERAQIIFRIHDADGTVPALENPDVASQNDMTVYMAPAGERTGAYYSTYTHRSALQPIGGYETIRAVLGGEPVWTAEGGDHDGARISLEDDEGWLLVHLDAMPDHAGEQVWPIHMQWSGLEASASLRIRYAAAPDALPDDAKRVVPLWENSRISDGLICSAEAPQGRIRLIPVAADFPPNVRFTTRIREDFDGSGAEGIELVGLGTPGYVDGYITYAAENLRVKLPTTVRVANEEISTGYQITVLPTGLGEIAAEAFAGTDLEMVIAGDVAQVGPRAFADMPNLVEVSFTNGDCVVAADAFSGSDPVVVAPGGSALAAQARQYGWKLCELGMED